MTAPCVVNIYGMGQGTAKKTKKAQSQEEGCECGSQGRRGFQGRLGQYCRMLLQDEVGWEVRWSPGFRDEESRNDRKKSSRERRLGSKGGEAAPSKCKAVWQLRTTYVQEYFCFFP